MSIKERIKDRLRSWLVPEIDQIVEDHRLLNNNLNYLAGTVERAADHTKIQDTEIVKRPMLSRKELQELLDNALASKNAVLAQTAIGPQEIAQKNTTINHLATTIDKITQDLNVCPQ